MLTTDLFEQVLVAPAQSGANQLYIVSGYASPAIAYKQFHRLSKELHLSASIKLIIGMAGLEGIAKSSHKQFRNLAEQYYDHGFECWYLRTVPPVHSKVYSWFHGATARKGFIGSANYSNSGFFTQREAVSLNDPAEGRAYFESLLGQCINCTDPDVESTINLTDREIRRALRAARQTPVEARPRAAIPREALQHQPIRLDLLRGGEVPMRSGLNWGQRPEYGRNPDQAYIPFPAAILRAGFFPPKGQHFTIVTDDNKTFDAVVAQMEGKAIETPADNSILGRYFRDRLGLPSGALVQVQHLIDYGRTDVIFSKVDDETYFMDFSRPR